MDEDNKELLITYLDIYRGFSFFKKYEGMPTAELAEKLNEQYESDNYEEIDINEEGVDKLVLNLDKDRVWWVDLEADVCADNKVYVRVLSDLASISRDSFSPSSISEIWESEEGPITVTFETDGKSRSIHPEWCNDWIDLNILNDLNCILKKNGYRYEVFEPEDQAVQLLALSRDEKQGLIDKFSWKFASYDEA